MAKVRPYRADTPPKTRRIVLPEGHHLPLDADLIVASNEGFEEVAEEAWNVEEPRPEDRPVDARVYLHGVLRRRSSRRSRGRNTNENSTTARPVDSTTTVASTSGVRPMRSGEAPMDMVTLLSTDEDTLM